MDQHAKRSKLYKGKVRINKITKAFLLNGATASTCERSSKAKLRKTTDTKLVCTPLSAPLKEKLCQEISFRATQSDLFRKRIERGSEGRGTIRDAMRDE